MFSQRPCLSRCPTVISPACTDKLCQELDQVKFVTVTIDASSMKEVKLVPIVCSYILLKTGVKNKLLEFKSVPGETAEILREAFGPLPNKAQRNINWILRGQLQH